MRVRVCGCVGVCVGVRVLENETKARPDDAGVTYRYPPFYRASRDCRDPGSHTYPR